MDLKKPDILSFRITLVMALILITYLATTPIPEQVAGGINDKLSHLLAFYALTLLADFSFPRTTLGLNKIGSLFAYGLMIELVQYSLPYREFSVADLLANGFGIFCYWLTIPLLRRFPRLKARWAKEHG